MASHCFRRRHHRVGRDVDGAKESFSMYSSPGRHCIASLFFWMGRGRPKAHAHPLQHIARLAALYADERHLTCGIEPALSMKPTAHCTPPVAPPTGVLLNPLPPPSLKSAPHSDPHGTVRTASLIASATRCTVEEVSPAMLTRPSLVM